MSDLSKIRSLVASGDQETAVTELVGLLRADPNDVDAWLYLADLRDDPQERRDCYKRVLKLDPYNEQAQLQMRLMGGTTGLKINRPDRRPAEPEPDGAIPMPVETHPDKNIGAGDIASPDGETQDIASLQETTPETPDTLLSSLRTEWASAPVETTPPEEEPAPEPGENPADALRAGLAELPGKVKPVAGKVAHFTAKNRWLQILLIAVGAVALLALFLFVWARLIPVIVPGTLIPGPAQNYIPDQAALPAGFGPLDTPAGHEVISLPGQAEGFRQTFTNPDFARQGRETIVTYEVLVFTSEVDAQVSFLTAADVHNQVYASRPVETQSISPNMLARLDAAALLFARKDTTLQGNPAISYTLLLRKTNLFAKVTVNAPVDDVSSVKATNLRGPLYQALFYYASLLTNRLPLPASAQVTVPQPVFTVTP